MNGIHWIVQAFRRSFDYSGRSRRREYWSYALFTFLAIALATFIEDRLGIRDDRNDPIRAFLFLGLCIPGLAVSVRRLHDTNRSGWWVVLPVAPIVFHSVAIVGRFNSPGLFRIVTAAILLAPLVLLALMCVPGSRGPNRFGEDPNDRNLADRFA